MSYFFHLVNLKLLSRPMMISNCKKIYCQKLLNMDKTYDFVMKPPKIYLPGKPGKCIFFREIVIESLSISKWKNFVT